MLVISTEFLYNYNLSFIEDDNLKKLLQTSIQFVYEDEYLYDNFDNTNIIIEPSNNIFLPILDNLKYRYTNIIIDDEDWNNTYKYILQMIQFIICYGFELFKYDYINGLI